MLYEKLFSILKEFEDACIEIPHTKCSALPLIQFRLNLFNELADSILNIENDCVFKGVDDEIQYYKIAKPQFYKYGVFYNTIFKIVSRFPIGLKKGSKKYYFDCLKDVKDTFDRQVDMFEYYRAGYFNNDHVIFRKNFEERNIFAVLQGTQMIEDFLHNATDPRTFEEKLKDYPKFKWTGTKIQAVILVNVMVKGNLINNGNVTIADLMEYFQVTFNIDLKDYYKKYQDNINSDDPFKFLDFMKTIIENDIEKNLEKP